MGSKTSESTKFPVESLAKLEEIMHARTDPKFPSKSKTFILAVATKVQIFDTWDDILATKDPSARTRKYNSFVDFLIDTSEDMIKKGLMSEKARPMLRKEE